MLVIVGGNPVYNAPVDFAFTQRMSKVKLRIHMGLYADETSELCQWHIPEAHFLETWSDARAYDGTVTIMQPLIMPLYFGRSVHELLAAFGDQPNQTPYEIVKAHWNREHPGPDFEDWWRKAVHDGMVPNSALQARSVAFKGMGIAPAKPAPAQGLEIVFRPDPFIFDGRFANNGWLQELPRPLTTLTWDNAAFISPRTAERLGLQNEDLVELNYRGRKVKAPVWMVPGHADESVTVHLGYGRTNAGRVGNGVGFNAYALRTSDAPWFGSGLEIVKTGSKHPLAPTQNAHLMEGRAIVISGEIDEYRKNPGFAKEKAEEPPKELTIYPGFKYEGYAWGMTIDQTACVGCNACMVACQAENNIPVVGKDQVLMRRAMHWMRVDSYYKGPRGQSGNLLPAGAVHALRKCAVRAGVSGAGHESLRRRPQRYGVQPLRRHALLRAITAHTKCGASTSSSIRTGPRPASSCSVIPMSPCAAAASWKSAPTACSASTKPRSTLRKKAARSATAKSRPHARPPAPRRPSCSGISTIPQAAWRS